MRSGCTYICSGTYTHKINRGFLKRRRRKRRRNRRRPQYLGLRLVKFQKWMRISFSTLLPNVFICFNAIPKYLIPDNL